MFSEAQITQYDRLILAVRQVTAKAVSSLIAVSFFLTSSLWVPTSASAQSVRRVALVIGNSAYTDDVTSLPNPINDATDVADALQGIGFDVIRATNVDNDEFQKNLRTFALRAKGASMAVFYYAGHAMHFEDESYLMPVGVKLEDESAVRFDMISVENDVLKKAMRDVPLKVLILDACRDNPIATHIETADKSRSIGKVRGLGPLPTNLPAGQLIAYATAANQVAQDGDGRNSPFSGALKKHIGESGIEIRDMLDEVANDVHIATNGRQRPEVTASLDSRVFLNPGETDRDVWRRIAESGDVAQVNDFLNRFPKSEFASSARTRLQLLQMQEKLKGIEAEQAAKAQDAAKQAQAAQEAARRQQQAAQDAENQRKAAVEDAARQTAARKAAEAAAQAEAARQQDVARQEAERQQQARQEALRIEQQKADAARIEAARQQAVREEAARREAARLEAQRQQALREQAARDAAAKVEAARQDAARQEAARIEAARKQAALAAEAARKLAAQQAEKDAAENARRQALAAEQEVARQAALQAQVLQEEAARQAAVKAQQEWLEAARIEERRLEAARDAEARKVADDQEAARRLAAKQESDRLESAKAEVERQEAQRRKQASDDAERQENARKAQAASIDAAKQKEAEAARRQKVAADAEKRQKAAAQLARKKAAEQDQAAERMARKAEEAKRQRLRVARRAEPAVYSSAAPVRAQRVEAPVRASAPAAVDAGGCMTCGF